VQQKLALMITYESRNENAIAHVGNFQTKSQICSEALIQIQNNV